MQLSKLEIKGFKSFGEKITIHFGEGITGIVGPNGCGKSNVVDAIRWVLGEQKTKALRSDKMENMIFNGTKKRKALQMAEVSLSFNNTKNLLPTEYSEVTITRKYYRSGESEYLLNGVSCRLKDITNLFLDTGIASNSYAIIELKMVDDLLNDKDNSRIGLFEEAAGISKFKKRKKETMRKLGDTDADLERVEDLLFEIEKNMQSLEKQARQTERYYTLKEEYKTLSVTLARVVVKKHTFTFDSLTKQIEQEQDKKLNLKKEVAAQEAKIEAAKKDLIGKEKLLASRQKSLNEQVAGIRQYENDKKIKSERLRFLSDKAEQLKEQITQDKKSNERALFSIQSLEQEQKEASTQLQKTAVTVKKSQTEHAQVNEKAVALKREAEELNQAFRDKQNELYQFSKSLEIKEIQLNSLRQELDKTTSDSTSHITNFQEFETKIAEMSQKLEKKNKALAALKQKDEKLQDRITSTQKTVEVIREEQLQNDRQLDARQNEYNLTKSLVDNLEGFPEAIRFLKKKTEWKKNAPLLSDIISCPDTYRVTIENYLEPFLNYYVVDAEAEAYEAINILSDAAKGKANFFILDAVQKYTAGTAKMIGNALPATEIIEYDGHYKKLIQHLLNNVYIVEDNVTDMPVDPECEFITKSGKITKRRFSISGGSVGLFEGKKIGRAKNLEKLEEEIKSLTKKHNSINSSLLEKQQELEQLKTGVRKEAVELLQAEILQANEEYISIKLKKEQFAEMISNADLKKDDILEKIDTFSKELLQEKPRVEAEQAVLLKNEQKLNEVNTAVQQQNEVLHLKTKALNEETILLHQQQNRTQSLGNEITYKQESYNNSKERIEKNQAELKNTDIETKSLIEKNEAEDDTLVTLYDEKEQLDIGVNEAEKEYYQARGDIDETEKKLREYHHSNENIDALILELQNKLNENKLELTSIKERIAVEFDVNPDEILTEVVDESNDISEDNLREKVEKIKNRIDTMGAINPMAMEAFVEIKERHDFITTQKEDLIKAKESLLTTIAEIDEVAKKAFIEAFTKIKENFVTVFRSLFTEEDDCDLVMDNPDNPLESKIDIIAKPKGKRPLSINQLSGGEKTLTAISLLFSIYLLKPAPFCIFDEVDAPLDDANIDKFNNIIHQFSKDSQFIIVTHNKRTMTTTDIIYGITMIEQGVSRVVPVDLRELA